MRKSIGLFLAFSSILFFSCSLKYGSTVSVEDVVPEFSFEDAKYTRVEDGKISFYLEAGKLEQYKNSSATYAKDVDFTVYEDGELSVTGKCGYLSADTKTEIYNLHDDIYIDSVEKDLKVKGKNLKWNGKTEQLVSGRTDNVTVETSEVKVMGSGFSASGVSNSYEFSAMVSGDIETKDEENEKNDS